MLIKTPEFHRQFLHDLASIVFLSKLYREELSKAEKEGNLEISYNHQIFKSVKFVGSYPEKPYGRYITDIDLKQIISVNDNLILRLKQIFQNITRTNFTFVRFYCGEDSEMVSPWTINGEGGCSYNPEKIEKWLAHLQGILNRETYSEIAELIGKDTLSLADLIRVDRLLEPYISVNWTREDLARGYAIFHDKRYDLLTTLKDYKKKIVLKLIYHYKGDACLVDVSIASRDSFKVKNNIEMLAFTERNIYSIAKSLKRYTDPTKSGIYTEVFRSAVGNLTGIAARLELVNKAEKYRTFPPQKIQKMRQEISVMFTENNLPEMSEEILRKMIYSRVEKVLPTLRANIDSKYEAMISLYEIRAKEAQMQVPKKLLKKRLKRGYECPFFEIDAPDLKFICQKAVDALMSPKKLVKCVKKACENTEENLHEQSKVLFSKNNLSLEQVKDYYVLYRTVKKDETKVIQKQDGSTFEKKVTVSDKIKVTRSHNLNKLVIRVMFEPEKEN